MEEARDRQAEILERLKLTPRETAVALSYEREYPGCLEENASRITIAKQLIALSDGWAAPSDLPQTAKDVELLAMYSARFMRGLTELNPHTDPVAGEVLQAMVQLEPHFRTVSTRSSEFYTDVTSEGVVFLDAWAGCSFARLEIGHKHAAELYQTEVSAEAAVRAPWPAWSLIAPEGLFPTFEAEGPARIWCTGSEPTLLITVHGLLLMVSRAPGGVADEVKKIRQLVQNVCLAIPDPEALRKPSIVRAGKRGALDLEQARFILPTPVTESTPPTRQEMGAERSYERGQAIEIRSRRSGIGEIWKPARVFKITRSGVEAIWADGPQKPQHFLFSDIRPVQLVREAPKIGTPTLTAADIDRLNARVQDTPAPAPFEPQKLVLLKRPIKRLPALEPALPPSEPPPAEAPPIRQSPRVKLRRPHQTTLIGNFLRGARLARQMDQRQLGDKIGISNAAVSNIELGHIEPSDDVLLAYALRLELDIDQMTSLRDGEDPNGPAVPPPPPDPPRGIIAQYVTLEQFDQEPPRAPEPPAATVPPKPAPEAPQPPSPPQLAPLTRDPGDVFAFLDFCAALTKLCPMPPDGRRDEWQRAAAALWSIR